MISQFKEYKNIFLIEGYGSEKYQKSVRPPNLKSVSVTFPKQKNFLRMKYLF
jgi:hypothetical protein